MVYGLIFCLVSCGPKAAAAGSGPGACLGTAGFNENKDPVFVNCDIAFIKEEAKIIMRYCDYDEKEIILWMNG